MNGRSENKDDKDLWEALGRKELDRHALEELAQLLHQAKDQELRTQRVLDSPTWEKRTNEIESLFHHVISRIQTESKQGAADLAKRLVALEKLEKGFASLLVARIESMDHRIRNLQLERLRLEKLIDSSSKTIFGRLFTGIQSQRKLKHIKAELHALEREKRRVWQKKQAFNVVRSDILGKHKESAQSVLQALREEGLEQLQSRLLGILDHCLIEAETTGKRLGFSLGEDPAKSDNVRFDRFVRGLNPKEKALVDLASDANSYVNSLDHLFEELDLILSGYYRRDPLILPNRCLLLAKLLNGRRENVLVPAEQCVQLVTLFQQGGLVQKELLLSLVQQWPVRAQKRLQQVVQLIRRIAALNQPVSKPTLKRLAHLFRDLLIRYPDVLAGLSESERPVLTQRRRHQERINRLLDEVLVNLIE